MPQWQLFWPWQREELHFATTIDLGSGRVVSSEDIMDGHARRLRSKTPKSADQSRSENLTTAVRVVAPQLAPLTDLAQEIADKSAKALPADKFRNDLQRALESSHRQQHVRRTLGIQPAAPKDVLWWQSPWLMVLTTVVTLLALGWLYRRIRSHGDHTNTGENES